MRQGILDMPEQIKAVTDAGAAITAFATLFQVLPAIAAAVSIIWYGIRIYEYFKSKKLPKDGL